MQFRYPARLQSVAADEVLVTFRDFPECLTSGGDHATAFVEAHDALEEAIAGRIDDGEPIPTPSPRRRQEQLITVPPDLATEAAFAITFDDSNCVASYS